MLRAFNRLGIAYSFMTLAVVAQVSDTAGSSVSVPRLVTFSGMLRDGNGKPQTGPMALTFSLYGEPDSRTPLWQEKQSVAADETGRYTVQLGAATANGVPLDLFTSGKSLWLGVQRQSPGSIDESRVLLVSVPYALKAADAETLGGRPASEFVTRETTVAAAGGEKVAAATRDTVSAASTVGGAGTANYAPLWVDSANLGNSVMYQSGTKVGVGTTTPSYDFDVFRSQNQDTVFEVRNPNTGSAARANLRLFSDQSLFSIIAGSAANGGGLYFQGQGDTLMVFQQIANAPMAFFTNNAERMRLTAGGKLGIGTTAPSALLEVNGTAKFDGPVTFASTTTAGGTFTGASGTTAGFPGVDATGGSTTQGSVYGNTYNGAPGLKGAGGSATGSFQSGGDGVLGIGGGGYRGGTGVHGIGGTGTNGVGMGGSFAGGTGTGTFPGNLGLLAIGGAATGSGNAGYGASVQGGKATGTGAGGAGISAVGGDSASSSAGAGISAQGGDGISGGDGVIAIAGSGSSQGGMAGRFQAGTGTDVVIGNPGCLDNNNTPYGAALSFVSTGGNMTGCNYSIFGYNNALNLRGPNGIYNYAFTGFWVYGHMTAENGVAVYGDETISGDLSVTGAITAGTKDFRIDDPIDPEHKYLYHASVESSEMKNIYDGVVVLDGRGQAVVTMPDWFEALNENFRYQLTAVGRPAPGLYIAEELRHNRFTIAGGRPGTKVCWLITGIRHDDFARAHPLHVREDKPAGSGR